MDRIIDSEPPLNGVLSAKYKKSFAYCTITDRVPVIVTGIIDQLSRGKNSFTCVKIDDSCIKDEIKSIIGDLSELKYQIQTAKSLNYLNENGDSDVSQWNANIKNKFPHLDEFTCYSGPWLFVECYIYRKIHEIFFSSSNLKSWDPFYDKKEVVTRCALSMMPVITDNFLNSKILEFPPTHSTVLINELTRLIKLSIWSNKIDLSLTSGNTNVANEFSTNELDKNLVVDESDRFVNFIFASCTDRNEEGIVDYVLDNAGHELLCDLCLADFLMSVCKVTRIRFRCKRIPWFVSDVMEKDFHYTINTALNESSSLNYMARRWKRYLDTGAWTLHSDNFFTMGLTYHEMVEEDPHLFKELSHALLVILKGDLNYRKLIQDRNWEPTTPIRKAIGDFLPCPLLALRSNKADTIAGLESGAAEKFSKLSPKWLVSGEYGLIQFIEC